MAAALMESMSALTLESKEEVSLTTVNFKIAGMPAFELELELTTAVRDVKKLAKDLCNIEPEHMRLIYEGRVLKESDTLECYKVDGDAPLQLHFTAGHEALVGGSQNPKVQRNPFTTPVRGIPGSKGLRPSRVSGRLGAMGIIRKYGIMMKRQEFREHALEIGFVKYS
mmetsp:Transcript_63072/g.205829  ORF Transcript_63072/g.205829 Transcript_63072/m.205829 type:complete len:168 (+) Transcript_63072:74-577(+)|eukprot:CAMPEP_0203867954 /NCGR_PEP_ID=MMETSP0359-20131031/16828_1 /ASSEMBLY_ACC=CAM_ASM_000338 /TAXON_ID=268821 /ORGANISM="Scrippsiella Hangoei, Strain SHTV-5" /LENGTH=167 /DNA_ID=CAMNT_0050786293 /DNA_START=74 /DNA_END=577 /DNA_ORIENTATION=+